MGAEEVLQELKGNGWMSSRQILHNVTVNKSTLIHILSCLTFHNEILRKRDEKQPRRFLYRRI